MKTSLTHSDIFSILRYTLLLSFLLTLLYILPQTLHRLLPLPKRTITVENTKALSLLLNKQKLNLATIDIDDLSRKITAVNLPEDLADCPPDKRTKLFISLMLPHIRKSNQTILLLRKELIAYISDKNSGIEIGKKREKWFQLLSQRYHTTTLPPEELLHRVDIIPASLALAQAITESGWGTSRFARQANALFGQHLSGSSTSKYITSLYGNVRVAAFDSLQETTSSYMHNLNTSRAYKELRDIRHSFRDTNQLPQGLALAQGLRHYSEMGSSYISDIQHIIHKYNLAEFDTTQTTTTEYSMSIKFSRKKQS